MLEELLFVAKVVSQQWGLELFLLMTVVVVKLVLALMDYQHIWVGSALILLHGDSLVDHTENLQRVYQVALKGMLEYVDPVTVIGLSYHLELVVLELLLFPAHQASVILMKILFLQILYRYSLYRKELFKDIDYNHVWVRFVLKYLV